MQNPLRSEAAMFRVLLWFALVFGLIIAAVLIARAL